MHGVRSAFALFSLNLTKIRVRSSKKSRDKNRARLGLTEALAGLLHFFFLLRLKRVSPDR